MKKSILLIICMAVCLSLIGGAIAVSYYKAAPVTNTITADSYMALSIGGSSDASITVAPNSEQTYDIYANIDSRSTSAASEKAQLVITITTKTGDYDLSDITFGLYKKSDDSAAYVGSTGATVDGSGELTFTVSNIENSTQYYLKLEVGSVDSAEDLAKMQGNINISLIEQA